MSGVLNKLKEGVYIDNYGKKHNVKEMYYISSGAKLRIWPQDTWAAEVELRRLNDAGDEIARYKVQQSSELDTTYYINGNDKLTGLPPGKYAMVATIVHSSLEIINKKETECWCTHATSDGPSSGNQIQFISSGSLGFNEANKTKLNPFTMERHNYSVIEILDGDIDVEQIQCPFMYYVVRKNYNGFEGFMVGAIPGSNTAPLRIVREKPTTGFVVYDADNKIINSNALIYKSKQVYPKYRVAWSSGAENKTATFTVPFQNGYVGKSGSNVLLVNKNPVNKNETIYITLKYETQTKDFELTLVGKQYGLKIGDNTYINSGASFDLSKTITASLYYKYCNGSTEWKASNFTNYTVANTNIVQVSGQTLTPVGSSSTTLTITNSDGTFTWTINAIAQYTCKLFTNGSAGTEVVLKDIPGNIIEIYNPGTYELKVYQGQTEISNYVAKLVNNSKFTSYVAGDTWKPKDENDECKIGGTLSKGANGALTYHIAKIEGSVQKSLGYVQIIVVTGF